jgi:MFS family permease
MKERFILLRDNFNSKIIYLTILHLIVDLVSVSSLYIFTKEVNTFVPMVVIYAALAFVTQPITGIIADALNLKILLSVSFGLLVTGYILANNQVFIFIFFIGIANSLFHSVGYKGLSQIKNSFTSSGLFVSSGAIGLGIGVLFFNIKLIAYLSMLIALILILAFIYLPTKINTQTLIIAKPPVRPKKITIFFAITLILICLMRTLLGSFITIPKAFYLAPLIIGIVSCLGKFIGGLASDLFGFKKVLYVVIVALIIVFTFNNDVTFLIGVFLINISMSITLKLFSDLSIKNKAFLFGSLSAIIFIGTILGTYLKQYYSFNLLYIIIIINSLLMLLLSYLSSSKIDAGRL